MSFSDLNAQRSSGRAVTGGSGGGPASAAGGSGDNALSSSLIQFQKSCATVKDRITEMRRRKVGPAEKAELDNQIRELRETDSRLKNQLDFQMKQLENAPRTPELAQKRIALGKLGKDFDKIKVGLQSIYTESALIQVTQEGAGGGKGRSGKGGPAGFGDDETRGEETTSGGGRGLFQKQVQEPRLIQQMQGQEVDDAIMEERDRDIRKMNQDLHLVNEMMRDMANIVVEQGAMVKEIHESTIESHEKASAGLDQVKQAAAYQPGCTIC